MSDGLSLIHHKISLSNFCRKRIRENIRSMNLKSRDPFIFLGMPFVLYPKLYNITGFLSVTIKERLIQLVVRSSLSLLFGSSCVFSTMCLDVTIPPAIIDQNRQLVLLLEVSSAFLTRYHLNNSTAKCSLLMREAVTNALPVFGS